MRIIHRDIKGGNCLVDDVGTIKLADFGASRRLDGESTIQGEMSTLCGTPYFLAPEVLTEGGGGRKADIWSLGGTVLQMLTGEPPWKSKKFSSTIGLMHHIASRYRVVAARGGRRSLDSVQVLCVALLAASYSCGPVRCSAY